MCGVVGIFSTKSALTYSSSDVASAMELMHYRGPDSRDCYVSQDGSVILGHLRLSIHDLSDLGKQPMHLDTVNGLYTVVFNGEVYNFYEIKSELISLGYHFHTQTDTEVVLAAYAAWGRECVSRFNGMFAIAIYDHAKCELFLSRDRLGKKPLYYAYDEKNGVFVFASEIKAILKIRPELSDLDIDPQLINAFMTLGYTPGEQTLFNSIKRVLPASNVIVSKRGVESSRYWSLHFPSRNSQLPIKSEQEWVNEGKSLFIDSLKLRLRSDVKVGVFLSGGLDSSAVVAGLSQEGLNLNTYSVRFDGESFGNRYDESIHAKAVSSAFGTRHQTITMTADVFRDSIDDYIFTMDEPVTEAAALSLGLLSGLAKKDVTVVLSGEGADELFGGYEIYRRMIAMEKIRSALTPAGVSLAALFARALPAGSKIRKYTELTNLPFEKRYRGVSVYPEYYRNSLFLDDVASKIRNGKTAEWKRYVEELFSKTKNSSTLSRMLHFDTHTWLVDDLLIKADRMSMRHSLELRCPFLDYRLVEFAASMPDHIKIKRNDPKWIVKQWFKDVLPQQVTQREKVGFPTPLQQMFKSYLKEYVSDHLLSSTSPIYAFFDPNTVSKLCKEHFSGKSDHHTVLWQLLVLDRYLCNRKKGV